MASKNYGLITDTDELRQLVGQIRHDGRPFGYDIETGYLGPDKEKASVRPETAFVAGISFTDSTDWARYVPLGHNTGDNLDNREVAEIFWPLLNSAMGVAHNAQFELRHLSRWFKRWLSDHEQVTKQNGYFPIRSDTMVEAYLAADFERFGLKPLTMLMFNRYGEPVDRSQYLSRIRAVKEINAAFKDEEERKKELAANFDGHIMTELYELFEDMPKNRRKFLRFNTLETDARVVAYACEDSTWCLAIHQRYFPEVSRHKLFPVEIAIVRDVLPEMADEGLVYDWPTMSRTAEQLTLFKDSFNGEIMTELSTMLGEPTAVNLASPPQISKILYEKLGYATDVYTDKTRDLPPEQRRMSTGKIALERLAQQYPIVQKIREWKKMTRLLGTYLEKYEKTYRDEHTGRAHGNYLSAFVITGRFAAVDPPVQQSPKKYHFDLTEAKAAHEAGEEPPPGTCFTFNFRDVIVAPSGWYILGFDLSQAELRAIAGEAQELALLEAFERGDDVHKLTASLMLGVPLEDITAPQRDIGKAQPVDELALTPFGWRRIGDLIVGDEVMARDGSPTKVTGVYPQGKRQIYEVKTSDGGSVRASDEHWWQVEPISYDSRLMTTEQLAKTDLQVGGRQYRYHLPAIEPPQLHGSSLELDPYLLGLLIGDGSMMTETPMFCSADPELIEAARAALPHQCELNKVTEKANITCPSYRIIHRDGMKNTVAFFLRHFGLAGKKAHYKFVPSRYLTADPASRLALLQGLLDTDGSVAGLHSFEFSSASLQLVKDVQQLVWSLGGRARFGPTTAKTAWRLWGRLPFGVAPFRLQRKLHKMATVPSKHAVKRAIVSVEPVGFEECVCISVQHPERLYITKDYIPTHNTMNFALLYGMSTKGLADRLGIGMDEAQELMDKYFAGLPAIAAYMTKMKQHGQSHGYVTSHFGRKLPIWEYTSDKRSIRSKGDRACVNYPIQGAATGDYMKIAMIRACAALRNAGLADRAKLVMNVHDALEFYIHESLTPEQVIPILQAAVIFGVTGWPSMQADWHIATKWGSPTELMLTADGTLDYKGATASEILSPQLELDEDGDYVEVLPEVDTEVLKAVVQAAPRPVIVRLSRMPREDSWNELVSYLKSLKTGPVKTIVDTPQGQIELPFGTRLTPADRDWISTGLDDSLLQVVLL